MKDKVFHAASKKQTGPVMYNSAAQAAEDLRRRGYAVGEIPGRIKSKDVSEETLQLLPWEVTEACPEEKHRLQEQIREKLRVLQNRTRRHSKG